AAAAPRIRPGIRPPTTGSTRSLSMEAAASMPPGTSPASAARASTESPGFPRPERAPPTRAGNRIPTTSSRASPSTAAEISTSAPTAHADVHVLVTDGGGNVYAAGSFTTIGGQSRNGLAKLSASGGAADSTWNPNPTSAASTSLTIAALVLDGSGNVYAAGSF